MTSTQSQPQMEKFLSDYWIVFYRHGVNPALHKVIHFSGNLLQAKKRAIDHCKIMGYKFIFIRPLVIDIEAEEQYKLKGGSGEFTPPELDS